MEAPAEIIAELRRREPVFHNEPRAGGREHLEAMMVSDFFEVGASGRIYTREHVIDRVLGRLERDEPEIEHEVDEFQVREISPNVYLTTYTLRQPDGPTSRITRRTTIWAQSDDLWQVVYHQGTMAEPTPA